jgi:hypothetical protein
VGSQSSDTLSRGERQLDVRNGDFVGGASGREAVELLGRVLAEREKTKRLLIGAACLFFLAGSLVVVFAPPSKQGLAYALGSALVVMALGAIGASRFSFKLPGVSVETNDGVIARSTEHNTRRSHNDGADTMR